MGASDAARGTARGARHLEKLIAKGLQNDGFSFIEAMDQCPTYYGRKNKQGDAYAMMKRQQELSVHISGAASMSEEKLEVSLVVGELWNRARTEYARDYGEVIARAQGGGR